MQREAARGAIKSRRRSAYYDYNLLAVVIILICFGLVMLYSASSYEASNEFGDDMFYFGRQALISAGAVAAALGISRVDYHIFKKWSLHLFVLALILMAMVKFTPLGVASGGARRWLNLGIQFQPAEIAKVAVILFLPFVILKMGKKVRQRKAVLTLLGIGLIQAAAAYLLTDNLSTAIIIMGVGIITIFVSNPRYLPFLWIGGAGIAFIAVFLSVESYRLERLAIWRNPEAYDKGFHTIQGLYAIGSGGIFGKGLGSSLQKLGFVPEAQNDMIFSIICEELGLVGAVLVMLVFALLIWRLMVISTHAPDLCGALIAAGIMGHIAIQVILNIAVVTNSIPNTGITLPFISYGGTSVVFLLGEMGLALSVSANQGFSRRSVTKT